MMNMCLIHQTRNNFTLCAGGMGGVCNIYDVKLELVDHDRRSSIFEESNRANTPNSLRHRAFSFGSQRQSSVEEGASGFSQFTGEIGTNLDLIENIKKSDAVQWNIMEHRFKFKLKKSIKTDFFMKDNQLDAFQKIVRYSPAVNDRIFTAGADGYIRLWTNPDYDMIKQVEAHKDEIDDVDIHPKGTHLVTVSRDGENKVWTLPNMDLQCKLDHRPNIPVPGNQIKLAHFQSARYICRGCRYGQIDDNMDQVQLFTILNPAVNTKPKLDSFLCSWVTGMNKQYTFRKIISTGEENIYSLSIRFVSIILNPELMISFPFVSQ